MNNILIFDYQKIKSDHFLLEEEEVKNHIQNILGKTKGDKIKICHLNQGIREAQILKENKKNIEIKTLTRLEGRLPWCNLIIGLSRPQTCKKILEHATSLGVSSFTFFKAQLSEKDYSKSHILSRDKYKKYLYAGLSQSKNYYKLPDVSSLNYLKLSNTKSFANKFILSLDTNNTFNDIKLDPAQNINLAIGPERGWSKEEEENFIAQGFKPIKISTSTLRVEIATFIALGQLEMKLMDLQ